MLRYLPGVTTLELDVDACIGCGMCADVCPHAVFEIKQQKSHIVERDACMECGACAQNCPVDAIQVQVGVGCAAGVIMGALRGTEACCDDGSDCCG